MKLLGGSHEYSRRGRTRSVRCPMEFALDPDYVLALSNQLPILTSVLLMRFHLADLSLSERAGVMPRQPAPSPILHVCVLRLAQVGSTASKKKKKTRARCRMQIKVVPSAIHSLANSRTGAGTAMTTKQRKSKMMASRWLPYPCSRGRQGCQCCVALLVAVVVFLKVLEHLRPSTRSPHPCTHPRFSKSSPWWL